MVFGSLPWLFQQVVSGPLPCSTAAAGSSAGVSDSGFLAQVHTGQGLIKSTTGSWILFPACLTLFSQIRRGHASPQAPVRDRRSRQITVGARIGTYSAGRELRTEQKNQTWLWVCRPGDSLLPLPNARACEGWPCPVSRGKTARWWSNPGWRQYSAWARVCLSLTSPTSRA